MGHECDRVVQNWYKKLGSSNQGGLLEVVESFFAKRTEESVLVETCVLSFVLLELK